MRNNQQEYDALCRSLNLFTKEMKDELHVNVLRGKRGWDALSYEELRIMFREKIKYCDKNIMTVTKTKEMLIDLSNILMFMHKALKDGR